MIGKFFFLLYAGVLLLLISHSHAEDDGPIKVRPMDRSVTPVGSLKTVPVPGPPDDVLAQFIKNKQVAIRLGKALFWDTRVGSDNLTACASCHFHAGVDNRATNQMGPGLLANDNTFQKGGTNYTLRKGDFPLTTNDIASSQGVFHTQFKSIVKAGQEECKDLKDDVFHALSITRKNLNTRKVEPRHTPSVINAVFNFRNFWDGRAVNTFNGVDPFGLRNLTSYTWKVTDGSITKVPITINTSSLTSQASGPPLSAFEMSCRERAFRNVAQKLLKLPILTDQTISKTDSVLGQYFKKRPKYEELIKAAFRDEFWNSQEQLYGGPKVGSMDLIDPPNVPAKEMDGYSQIESNFALFFGLAIQLYESTLVSDDSPFDRFSEGNTNALTEQQKRGLAVFNGPGACVFCHSGPEFTSASVSSVSQTRISRIFFGDRPFHDTGFFNIGVRPSSEDLGGGGTDAFGNPLSETMMIKNGLTNLLGDNFDPTRNPTPDQLAVVHVDGTFKTPTLRNVELTGPYFHNGGKSSLRQVVDFYVRGGDFPNGAIRPLNLTEEQKTDLVAFLLSLTDDRVRLEKAPFDHPSICVPNGHREIFNRVLPDGRSIRSRDNIKCIDAVGSNGLRTRDALKPFLGISPFAQ